MQFKELELKSEGSWLKRTIHSAHFKKSIRAIIIGAIVGFGFFYLTEGRLMNHLAAGEILKSIAIGGFFGFFITNSPCARGRC